MCASRQGRVVLFAKINLIIIMILRYKAAFVVIAIVVVAAVVLIESAQCYEFINNSAMINKLGPTGVQHTQNILSAKHVRTGSWRQNVTTSDESGKNIAPPHLAAPCRRIHCPRSMVAWYTCSHTLVCLGVAKRCGVFGSLASQFHPLISQTTTPPTQPPLPPPSSPSTTTAN